MVAQAVAEKVGVRRTFGDRGVGPLESLAPFEKDFVAEALAASASDIVPLAGEGFAQKREYARVVCSGAEVPKAQGNEATAFCRLLGEADAIFEVAFGRKSRVCLGRVQGNAYFVGERVEQSRTL